MLFNSALFLFVFLPVVVVGYHLLVAVRYLTVAKLWLVLSSLYFYAYWKLEYLPLLVISIGVNYYLGLLLCRFRSKCSASTLKLVLIGGIAFNLGLLGYFKYFAFILEIISSTTGATFSIDKLLLPLAISFFTFQQLAYLVDCYKGFSSEYKLLNYCVFVTFFPQLIAGPIVHHKQMMPQFEALQGAVDIERRDRMLLQGLFVFSLGLFKKVCIADSFATFADVGYASASLNIAEAWMTSLSYTLQLYYDFSGYSDMAIGAALIFSIRLPINFFSPYRATTIQQFWRSWHITLSNWLRDYVFIPLGGSRGTQWVVCRNLLLTFLLGGIWHGAGWTFIIWGVLHGVAMVTHRLWRKLGISMPVWLAWFITFNFVNLAWVFFRADSVGSAVHLIQTMFSPSEIVLSGSYLYQALLTNESPLFAVVSTALGSWLPVLAVVVVLSSVFVKNTMELSRYRDASMISLGVGPTLNAALAFVTAALMILSGSPSVFLYFNF
ncbi:MAG: alginate O-acetyltransferase complex protein AlgI [Halieaceae bacterium]|jgi:D-alanyl-lipoteichoic acid acyltransferase DltB (MBOAT superfamily)